MRRLALLALLTGCSGVETRTAIKIALTGDADEIRENADTLWLILDPEEPYSDSSGEAYEAGDYGSNSRLADVVLDDDDLEFIVELELGDSGDLPVIELSQGRNTSAFQVSARAYLGTAQTADSEVEGPLSWVAGTTPTYNVAIALLDEPRTQCNNGRDDDEDGWTDLADPDCADGGTEELGFAEAECNDGQDNDEDVFIDSEDPDCDDALDETEQDPCADGIDNDEDGWTDLADPDCDTYGEELDFGDTACNDGIDNDEDGYTDAEDPECGGALDDDEAPLPCENGDDDDGDGWIDTDDPDCTDTTDETDATSDYECNDASDNDGDGDIDVDDPSCEAGWDDSEQNDCEDEADNDGEGWVKMEDPR